MGLALYTSPLLGVQPHGLLEHVGLGQWQLQRVSKATKGKVRFACQHEALAAVLAEHSVAGVVYGMPYHKDGSYSVECRHAETAAQALQAATRLHRPTASPFRHTPHASCRTRGCTWLMCRVLLLSSRVPVLLWDESWTTREALGRSGPPKATDAVWSHAAAACIILQVQPYPLVSCTTHAIPPMLRQ
jgi:RNase H-fold protein (predicted Holliday junction resolvase)